MDKKGNIITYQDKDEYIDIPDYRKKVFQENFEWFSSYSPKYFSPFESDITKEIYMSQSLDKKNSFFQQFIPIISNGEFLGILGIQEYYNKHNDLKKVLFKEIFLATVTILAIAIIFSIFLAKNIKKGTLGLDPIDIGKFYNERKLIFDAISDEIITIDHSGKITKMNTIAEKNLKKSDEVELKKLYEEIILDGNVFSNREYKLTSGIVYITTLIVDTENSKSDILFIIKSAKIVKKLAEEITGVTQIINSMRANVHEFKNKIHVISGLLRLEEYEEAKKYIYTIKTELDNENEEVEGINNPILKALLLTKINLAKERKITLTIEEGSNLMTSHKNISSDDLIIIIGNLIENAMESFPKVPYNKEIKGYFLEDNNKIYIEISDNGAPIKNIENIFKIGVSSKGEGRGSGLALIKNITNLYNGTININEEEDFKTFSIELMKEES
jgi:two-component system CitB family sensor kinase